ncbi:MAG: O-antigen ligase family protein [Clostridia bacterium]|nr:O-antigen ligase family protein [Clostridia bacterium]
MFLLTVCLFLHWILAAAAVLAASVYVLSSKKRLLAALFDQREALYLFFLLFLFSVGSLFLKNPLSAVGFLGVGLFLLVAFWVRSFMTRRRFDRMIDVSLVMSFYCALYGVVDRFVFHASSWESYLMESSTNNANYYGILLVFWILSAFFRLEQTGWRGRVFFYLFSVLLNFTMLLFTESVSSFLALILALLLFLFLCRRYKSFVTLLGGLGVVTFFGVLSQRSFLGGMFYIFLERVEMWRIGWRSVTESVQNLLFGQGLFSYQEIWDAAPHSFWDVRGIVPRDFQPHAHNLYLELILSVGFLGVLLLMLYGAFQVFLLLRRAKTPSLRLYSVFLFVVCAAVFVSGISDVSVFWMQSGMFFFLLCSCTGIKKTPK